MSDKIESTPAASLDLADLDLGPSAEQGATMPLLHPVSAEPVGTTMEVMGADAPTYRKNLRKLRDMLAKQPEEEEQEDPDQRNLTYDARLAACAVRSWKSVVWQGATLDYSFDNAVMLFTARPWIADQVRFFRDRRANFFKD